MKFNKILLIIGIVTIVSAIAMSTSFATSSEKLIEYKGSSVTTYNKKISSIDEVSVWKNGQGKEYYKINVKKAYRNKYKIKSVTMGYFPNDNRSYYEPKDMLYKNFTGKNKNNLKIKFSSEVISPEKLTINYYTKGKIKKESLYLYSIDMDGKSTKYLTSKKANAKLTQKVYVKNTKYSSIPSITYQKLKIITKNQKYKLKLIKLGLVDFKKKKIIYKTFKGYGKNSFKIQLYRNTFIQGIKVYYY